MKDVLDNLKASILIDNVYRAYSFYNLLIISDQRGKVTFDTLSLDLMRINTLTRHSNT